MDQQDKDKAVAPLMDLARRTGRTLTELLAELFDKDVLVRAVEDSELDDALRDKARGEYGLTDKITVDEDAVVSHTDDGAWVAGWLWVDYPDEEAKE